MIHMIKSLIRAGLYTTATCCAVVAIIGSLPIILVTAVAGVSVYLAELVEGQHRG